MDGPHASQITKRTHSVKIDLYEFPIFVNSRAEVSVLSGKQKLPGSILTVEICLYSKSNVRDIWSALCLRGWGGMVPLWLSDDEFGVACNGTTSISDFVKIRSAVLELYEYRRTDSAI
jgi:hypothetical protein